MDLTSSRSIRMEFQGAYQPHFFYIVYLSDFSTLCKRDQSSSPMNDFF